MLVYISGMLPRSHRSNYIHAVTHTVTVYCWCAVSILSVSPF